MKTQAWTCSGNDSRWPGLEGCGAALRFRVGLAARAMLWTFMVPLMVEQPPRAESTSDPHPAELLAVRCWASPGCRFRNSFPESLSFPPLCRWPAPGNSSCFSLATATQPWLQCLDHEWFSSSAFLLTLQHTSWLCSLGYYVWALARFLA